MNRLYIRGDKRRKRSSEDEGFGTVQGRQEPVGKGGAFAPLQQRFLEEALDVEMEEYLNGAERSSGNKRNGKGRKMIKSSASEFTIETLQDRNSSFEPEIVKKWQTILADNLQDKII